MAADKLNIQRRVDLSSLLKKKSHFLLGPRQTGKSWLIRHNLASVPTYNLLDEETYLKLSRFPQRLREEHQASDKVVVIDEIQRLPNLLNEVHLMIEEHGTKFLLTGSSARKLRRGGVNLLGGRAWTLHFHPFSFIELKNNFEINRALNNGLLPSVYFSDNPDKELKSYIGTYLKEEIAAEGVTRNIPAFGRFLEVAALCNGKLINYMNISNDAQVPRTTVQEYFEILKDSMLAHEVKAWTKSVKRKSIGTSKIYLFDVGVTRVLQNRGLVSQGSPEFGELFESYLFQELQTYCDYELDGKEVCYWRSQSGFEADFIFADQTAIEVKTSSNVGPYDLKGLTALSEEKKMKRHILVSFERKKRRIGQIEIYPWKDFLTELWAGEFNK